MGAGTDYQIKEDLLNAIDQLIYTNNTFDVTADMINTACQDIVESLWNKISGGPAVELTYAQLIDAINNDALLAGQVYLIDYDCIHIIPGTAVLNTDSPQYVANTEKFYILALNENEVSPVVTSQQHIYDYIIYDINDDLAEDGTTPRPGKVLYRKDTQNNLSTFYDFRGVLNRRGTVDSSATTTWTSGLNWSKGDIVDDGTWLLYRAGIDLINNTVFNNSIWYPLTSFQDFKWCWGTPTSFMNTSIARNNEEDFLTFQGLLTGTIILYSKIAVT